MIGSSSIHGIMTSFAEAVVQVGGEAIRVPASEIHRIGQGPVRVSEKSLRCLICLCSHNRSNRLPAKRCIKLKAGQQGGFSNAVNGWEAMTSG
jgi:hypothetical protein